MFIEIKKSKYLIIRVAWITLGSIFVTIGVIGILIPGMPTTVFLILAAACYVRSSKKLYNWLVGNKAFGKYIQDYRQGRGMPRTSKIIALLMIAIFVSYAVIFAIDYMLLRIIVLSVGIVGIWYVGFKVPTKSKD